MTAPNAAGDSVDTCAGERFTQGIDAAPAPLDPGNPEHLRPMREAVLKLRSEADEKEYAALGTVAIMLAAKIVRLETAAAEAEQDAKDRKLAAEVVRAMVETDSVAATAEGLVLAGVRAKRAAREGDAK